MDVGGNYRAIVQVKVSDSELKKQLESVSKKVKPLELKIDAHSNGLKDLGKELQTTTQHSKKLEKGLQTVAVSAKDASGQATTLGGKIKQLGTNFADTTLKVIKFGISTRIIHAFEASIGEAIQTVFEFDNVLTDFKKVSDLSGEALDNYVDKLGELGTEVARTRTEMLEASTEFKKSGYSDEDSAQLARVASLYQNVADSELSAGQASSYVISQMKAFDIEAEDAISIIDKTNEVNYLPSL